MTADIATVPVRRDALVLGLDIGGTKLAGGVVGGDGRTRSFASRPAGAADGVDAVLARLYALARTVTEQAGVRLADLAGIGIGCGGPVDTARGLVEEPPNLPGWRGIPLVALVEEELGRPTLLENDGVAAALGEYRYGAGRGAASMVYLTISTGVGGGVVTDGRVLRGRSGNGGELGHTIVVHDGRRCGCGSFGCLEAYCSGTAIGAIATERVAADGSSTLGTLGRAPTAADVAVAAVAGDPLAAAVWAESMAVLGSGVASMINAFECDVVVLGGGVTRAGDRLLAPVRDRALRLAFAFGGQPAQIRLSALGDEVGVVGAGAAALLRFAAEPACLPGAATEAADA